MRRASASFALASVLVVGPFAAGAGETKFSLTIDNIMRGPNLVGYEPAQIHWSGDNSKIYFQWKKASDPVAAPLDTYVVNRDGTELRKLTDEEVRVAPPAVVDTNEDRSLSVFSQDGDIVVITNAGGQRRQVMKTSDAETNPRFLADGHRITFQRGGNLFIMSLDNGDLEQLTDIRTAAGTGADSAPAGAGGRGGGRGGRGGGAPPPAGDTPKGTDAQEYLKKEQREMFDIVRERVKLKEEADAKQKKLAVRKVFTLPARQTIGQMQLSPDGKHVLAVITEAPNGTKNSNVPNWITDSSFPEDMPGRARVGDNISHRHLAIINVVTGEVKSVDHGETGTPADQTEDGPGCGTFGGGAGGGQPQTVYFSPDGTKAVFGARSQDNKTCWYFALDP
ncbi:MAG: hypothetical protein QOJ99_3229, partial [Bryobacterales bacterium]|nr:hypothetical protein [Bryobacterales bacterium]